MRLGPVSSMTDVKEIELRNNVGDVVERSVFKIFERRAKDQPEAIAIRTVEDNAVHNVELSYSEFYQKLISACKQLIDLGITKNDTISILLPNVWECHVAIWSSTLVGVANPINYLLEPEVIIELLNEVGCKCIIVPDESLDAELAAKLRKVIPRVSSIVAVLYAGRSTAIVREDRYAGVEEQPFLHLREPLEGEAELLPLLEETCPERTVMYFHTGGTTGRPKVARLSEGNILYSASIFSKLVGFQQESKVLVGLPLFHVNAVLATGLSAFCSGSAVCLISPFGFRNKSALDDFWHIVDTLRITHSSCVPTVLSALLAVAKDGVVSESLEYIICGAAPLSVHLFERFESRFSVKILEGYGLTEGSCVSTLNPALGERKVGSIGLRLPFQQVIVAELSSDNRVLRQCGVNEVGNLLIKGPNIFLGYLVNSQASLTQEGWLSTGDLARCDKDGYFWLVGRSKDLIIRGGHNIDPAAIESVIESLPGVRSVAAVGQPCSHAGELPCAYVVVENECDLSVKDISNFASENIHERAARPVSIELIEALPLTAVGKVDKPALRANAARRVIGEILRDGSLQSKITVRQDASLGQVVSVDTSNLSLAKSLLANLPLNFEFSES